jgi:outer membrane protein assembly factor BamB
MCFSIRARNERTAAWDRPPYQRPATRILQEFLWGKVGRAVLAGVGLLLAVSAAVAASADRAPQISDAVNRPVGLIHLPRGDAGLALALAELLPTARIHLQFDGEAAVHAARERFDQAGLINLRVYVDRGDLSRLLPAANSCDLIILDDLRPEELTPALAAELRRVLHPWYGVAMLGDTRGRLDGRKLNAWAEAIGESVEALPKAQGLAMVKAGPLAGADNWSHYWHGPENNAVSADTAYRNPETIQWTGKPYDATRLELPIVANGRLFMLWNGHLLDVTFGEPVLPGEPVTLRARGSDTLMDGSLDEQRGPLLEARATGSGVRLWERRLSPAAWLQTARSLVVARGDRLLVGDGSTLLVLDQATGRERRRIAIDGEEIKWIAATDQYVAVLGGPPLRDFPFPGPMRRRMDNVAAFRSGGLLLTVFEGEELDFLWQVRRDAGADAFDPRTPAIAGNRLFAHTEGGEAQAFDLATGAVLWRRTTGIKTNKEIGYLWDRVSRHPVSGFAVAGLYIVSGASDMDRHAVLSQEDGKPMWNLDRGSGTVGPLPLYFQDLIWFGGTARNPATGDEVRKIAVRVGGCGHLTAAPQGFVAQDGLNWDIINHSSVPPVPPKSACMASTFVANGLIWRITSGVWHIPEWRGFNVRAAAERELPAAAPRLAVSAATGKPENDVQGWTVYRANNARSASVASTIPENVEILWHATIAGKTIQDAPVGGALLGPAIMPTPPVTGGDTVVVAANDGILQAIDLNTGRKRWRARTGGRIQNSPTIWKDRVFVGSMDGCLYAFALNDGRQLWRLRVAPEAGRIMLFDQLASRWPVFASPLIENGTVYAVAGYMERLDGVWAVAADAISGELLWEQNQWRGPNGEDLSSSHLLGGTGQLCWDDRTIELIYSAGEGLSLRLSPGDGAPRAAYANGRLEELAAEGTRDGRIAKAFVDTHYPSGQDIGKFAPGWMLMGGSRTLIDVMGRGNQYDQHARLFSQDANGDGLLPVLRHGAGRSDGVMLMPSWDDTGALFVFTERRQPVRVALVSKEKLLAFVQATAESEGDELEAISRQMNLNQEEHFIWSTDHSSNIEPHAAALTPNAALLLTNDRSPNQQPQLIAFSRVDGTELWRVALPDTPVYGGLAVTHSGKAIVALRNGDVLCIGQSHIAPPCPNPQ